MPRTDTTANPNRSRSIILQPEDIVPLTAEEAAADIENAISALCGEHHGHEEKPPPRR